MGMRLNVTEGLRLLAMRAGMSMARVSKKMGYKTPASLINMVTRGTIRMKVGAAMAEACGYKMVLVPADTVIEDGIEIKGEVESE